MCALSLSLSLFISQADETKKDTAKAEGKSAATANEVAVIKTTEGDMVLEFWPENFQALYHAGMSEYALGRPSQARPLLERFMALYHLEDGFTRAARRALQRIQYGLPAEAGAQPEH